MAQVENPQTQRVLNCVERDLGGAVFAYKINERHELKQIDVNLIISFLCYVDYAGA